MRSCSESFVICSGGIVLECTCGERIVLLGQEADWHSEEHTVFECGGCEKKLVLTTRFGEESFKAKGFSLTVLALAP